jgi:hypothetical protein
LTQVVVLPEIDGFGSALIVIVMVSEAEHPAVVVSVTTSVAVPVLLKFSLTELPVVLPWMVAPVIDQAKVFDVLVVE